MNAPNGQIERLREAAALMRSRAAEALGPDYEWAVAEDADGSATWWAFTDEDHYSANGILTVRDLPQWTSRISLWEHVTGWSPAVAIAVADWLAECARLWEYGDIGPLMWQQANTVADAYLGTAPTTDAEETTR